MAARIDARGIRRVAANVVEVRAKIGEVVVEREGLRGWPVDLLQLLALVERHLRARGLLVERGTPRAPRRSVEAAAERLEVAKRRDPAASVTDSLDRAMTAAAG